MRKTPTEKQLTAWYSEIEQSGCKRLKLRSLLRCFGFKRRGTAVVEQVPRWLAGLDPPIYVHGINGSSLDDRAILAMQNMREIGDRASNEAELTKRFKSAIMPKLKLRDPQPQYCPTGTRDKLDFLCKDARGRAVVVELKYDDGQKRGVEQLLRYIGQLKAMGGHKEPRGILITGYADPWTRQALAGQDRDRHIRWFLYGIDARGRILLDEEKVGRSA